MRSIRPIRPLRAALCPSLRATRRALLKQAAAGSACASLAMLAPRVARAQIAAAPADRLLFVVAAAGGGAITESFLPVASSECSSAQIAGGLAVQPDGLVRQPNGSNLRCVANRGGTVAGLPGGNALSQEVFLQRHAAHTVVVTQEGTSVNHRVAQKRSLTGAGADRGRTLLEAVGERHGANLLLPNVNMATDGYLEPGDDPTLPAWARSEPVASAALFPFQTHGNRGLRLQSLAGAGAPMASGIDGDRLARVRGLRDALDDASPFARTFAGAPLRQQYLDRRRQISAMEEQNLIEELMMVEDDDLEYPLGRYGLSSSSAVAQVQEIFPDLAFDNFQAQTALAFLLARAGVGAAFAIAPSFQPTLVGATLVNTPLAFDFSHADHAGTQNVMWSRTLAAVSGLIQLLQQTPANAMGSETLWDRSLIYIATDFGRDKVKPFGATTWGTAHNLNNGVVMVSPLLHGNRAYGGVDPDTLLTYGFDPVTGDPAPGTLMREQDVYSIVASAMDVEFEGRRNFPAVVR